MTWFIRFRFLHAACFVGAMLSGCGGLSNAAMPAVRSGVATASGAPGIAVRGNELITTTSGTLGAQHVGRGVPVVLRGVNLSGTEYACLQQHSIWDDPKGDAATVSAMLRWHANVVRLPLDEECWLGINGTPKRYSGKNYAHAIARFTSLANSLGLIVEVDLHFGAAASGLPRNDRYPGLDLDHAPAFWRSVARTFRSNPSVIFNLINEPYITSWNCYRYGGCETPPVGKHGGWKVVGTQRVVDVIRATGAGNPIVIAGLKFPQYAPHDADRAIIAGAHVYFDELGCEDAACWIREL
ncbi:MAG: cellulase family glycosylhydrolase, partial [Candidatus Cybelea sp.]